VPDRGVISLYKSTPEVSGLTSPAVNGFPVKVTVGKGYAVITRDWKAGDNTLRFQ
jgi:uncharacterized protein